MYQALYRKWRPLVFADVVGQEHITSTLKNEVRESKIGHAYLFTGTRGTGKTTCAKILAKAVNCLDLQNGDPCNKCDVCVGINDGSILDIIEIDAASNNGVDDIRELRDEVVYAPTRVRKKVYIIDEVHMLSTAAFNALLKTLEEPPSHILFVLATTEIHKIPATILSRCQRFDFRRISTMQIMERLGFVCEKEGISFDREALTLVSKIADGSMRDGLSILDKCAGTGNSITVLEVLNCTGGASKEHIHTLSSAVALGVSSGCFEEIAKLYFNSKDMTRLCEELVSHYRDLLIIKTVKEPLQLLECSAAELNELTNIASKYKLEKVLYSINTLQETINKMYRSPNKRVEIEMALVKLCDEKLSDSNEALSTRISELEAKLRLGQFNAVSLPEKKEEPKKVEPEQEKTEAKTQIKEKKATFWADALANLKISNILSYSLLKDSKVGVLNDELIIYTDNATAVNFLKDEENKNLISQIVFGVCGQKLRVKCQNKQAKIGSDDEFSNFLSENSEDIEII